MSVFPVDFDDFTNPPAAAPMSAAIGGRTHSQLLGDLADAVESLQTYLGTESEVGPYLDAVIKSNRLWLDVVAFGADPTGVADSTAAFDLAIAAARTAGTFARGCTIHVPAGTYKLGSTVRAYDIRGLRILGAGHLTSFTWAGGSTVPMFELANARDCELAFFQIDVSTPLAMGIKIERDTASGVTTPVHNHVHHVWMQGNAGSLGIGIQIGATSDANNDFNFFEHVEINNYTIAGFKIEGTQTYGNYMLNCRLVGYTTAAYGVWRVNGYFKWEGGAVFGHAADFYLSNYAFYAPTIIKNCNSEGSKRFLEATRGGPGEGTFILEECRVAANGIHADKKIVDVARCQALIIRNCGFDSTNATAPFYFDLSRAESFEFVNNMIVGGAGVASYDPFPGQKPTTQTGSQIVDGDTVADIPLPGRVKLSPVTTAARPSAVDVGAGSMMYDSTLSKPIWSDGTVWRDAAGTSV